MTRRIIILGAGGHARSVADVVLHSADGDCALLGFTDRGEAGRTVIGDIPVLGDDDALAELAARLSLTHFIVGVGSVDGKGRLREALFERATGQGLKPFLAVHRQSWVSPEAVLASGTVVMAGACINAGTRIGVNGIVNTGAVIDHDCRIGDHVHIAPGATLSGTIRVGDHSLIGVGATIRQGVAIGAGATVGAGSTVVGDVDDRLTVVGSPARPRR